MTNLRTSKRSLPAALIATSLFFGSDAAAVRVSPDGHGQALIYPYYTARSTANNNPFVTTVAVTNTTAKPKALRVRFYEAKVGAQVLDFNLFLGAHDVWTAGIVGAGAGAGLFSFDHSCTSPQISHDPAKPTAFRNAGYQGDRLGDGLDRTYEGYFDVLEMGAIGPGAFADAVTASADYSSSNAARPTCLALPATDATPPTLSKPSGGLAGNVSYINVREGTAFTVDAIALSQWSNKVQWSVAGNQHPDLADTSPPVSYVVDSQDQRDVAYVSTWTSGRDAVSALFMVQRVMNDFTAEASLQSATDWVLAMPTKRFYVNSARRDPPFSGGGRANYLYACEARTVPADCNAGIYDRERQDMYGCLDFGIVYHPTSDFCGATAVIGFAAEGGSSNVSGVFQSTGNSRASLQTPWINGWQDFRADTDAVAKLSPAVGATTIIDLATGDTITGATVTYFGLPITGFGAQSFANDSLPGPQGNVLSRYGGQFTHKYKRRIQASP